MLTSPSPVSSPPRTPASNGSPRLRSPGLTYAQALAGNNRAASQSPIPSCPKLTEAEAAHATLDKITAKVATSNACAPSGEEAADTQPRSQHAPPVSSSHGLPTAPSGLESPTTRSIIDVDEIQSDPENMVPATTPIKREESPFELGKRHRIYSPSPSIMAPSLPHSPSKPPRAPRGRKSLRRTLSEDDDEEYGCTRHVEPTMASTFVNGCPSPRFTRTGTSPPTTVYGDNSTRNDGRYDRDTHMRSPSPSHSTSLRDRIPRHVKGKERYRPTPGPSSSQRVFDVFFDPPAAVNSRGLAHGPPLDDGASSCSRYPPIPSHYREEYPFRTPMLPKSPLGYNAGRKDHHPHPQRSEPQSVRSDMYPPRDPSPILRTVIPPHSFQFAEIPAENDDQTSRGSALKQYVEQQTENAPAEMDDFLKFTPVPIGGFPKIHHSSPLAHFDNIEHSQLLDWEREKAQGLVAIGMSFWGHGALDGDVDPRHKQLLSYATHLLNARFHTDRIMVAKPRPRTKVSQLNSAPHTTLVYGLHEPEAQLLCDEGVMSTPKLGLFFHTLDITFPSYIGAIHGLTTRLIQPIYELVIEHFLTPEAELLFRELTEGARNPVTEPNDAQAYFIGTMYVRRLDCRAKGNTLAPVFLLYMTSPATDYHSHRRWASFCRTINLSHSLYGSGVLKSPGSCAGCHGHDHPTGLCKFASLPNWFAPDPYHTPDFSIPTALSSTNGPQSRNGTSRRGRGGGMDNRNRRRRQGTRD